MPRRDINTPPVSLAHARMLRLTMSGPEIILWRRLRRGHLMDLKFRRQHPIGQYVVDFCCETLRLVVEIDGDSHATQVQYDTQRTEWLASQGYRVLRFTNHDVVHETEAVMETIWQACKEAAAGRRKLGPSPQPSPVGGGS